LCRPVPSEASRQGPQEQPFPTGVHRKIMQPPTVPHMRLRLSTTRGALISQGNFYYSSPIVHSDLGRVAHTYFQNTIDLSLPGESSTSRVWMPKIRGGLSNRRRDEIQIFLQTNILSRSTGELPPKSRLQGRKLRDQNPASVPLPEFLNLLTESFILPPTIRTDLL
jgi:hypothetical protein